MSGSGSSFSQWMAKQVEEEAGAGDEEAGAQVETFSLLGRLSGIQGARNLINYLDTHYFLYPCEQTRWQASCRRCKEP